MARNRNKPVVQTAALARRINFSATLKLFLLFLAMDFILIYFDALIPLRDALRFGSIPLFFETLWGVVILPKFLIIYRFEGIVLLLKVFFGASSIRKQLKPIDEITNVAFELGAQSNDFDEEKFHRLEQAINAISPTDATQLSTGDRDLAGLETAVNDLIARMREFYRQQARFVSDASHELRTPIAVIKGYADMLDRWGKTDEKVLTESIEAIKSESDHMNYLVEQLLFLARGDNGKTKMNLEDMDLAAMVRDVYEEYVMIDTEHHYSCSADASVPAYGDVSMLKQTARVLLDNAKKYTPAGGQIEITAKMENGEPVFTVTDTGVGISASDLPHIFERFYRADSARTRESGSTGGTGLGLAIANWIVTRHNGRFEVLTRENVGTRIKVILQPAKNPAPAAPTPLLN